MDAPDRAASRGTPRRAPWQSAREKLPRSRCRRSAGRTSLRRFRPRSAAGSASRRAAECVHGVLGLPASKARIVKEHHPNTFSAGVSPGSPQFGFDLRAFGAALHLAVGERTPDIVGDFLGQPFRHPYFACRPDVLASAWASWIAGSESRPPQLPERCPPSRASIHISKLTSRASRGRSSAVRPRAADRPRRSARRRGILLVRPRQLAQSGRSNLLAHLDQVFGVEAELPRVSSTARSAPMLMECWPLLSAAPRPYHRPVTFDHRPGRQPCPSRRRARGSRRHGHNPARSAATDPPSLGEEKRPPPSVYCGR